MTSFSFAEHAEHVADNPQSLFVFKYYKCAKCRRTWISMDHNEHRCRYCDASDWHEGASC